jgi:hypothetical protein
LEQLDRVAGLERSNVHVREESKEAILRSLGPTADEGFVHVPIERAMALLADKMPVRPATPADQQRREGGLVDGGEPNSGRAFKRGR